MGRRKTNKQAPLSKEGTDKKEEKAKKTYALPKAEEKGHAGDVDGVEKVSIPDRLEKEIVDLILQEHQNRKSLGVLSKRITTKKLTDVYNSLSDAGFSQRQVEGAMSATVAMGGDLHDALDWLCLNTPNERDTISRHPGFNPSTKLQVQTPVTKKPSEDKELDEIEQIMRESEPQAAKDTTRKSGKKTAGGGASRQPATGGDDEEEGFNLFGFDKMEEKAAAAKDKSGLKREVAIQKKLQTVKKCNPSVHQLLPPPYRAVWLEWLDAEQSAQQEAKEKENKPRDQFVSRLMKKLKMEDSDSGSAQQSGSPAQSAHSKAAVDDDDDNDDDETQDNWEDLADQDVASQKTLDPPKSSSSRVNTDRKMTPSSESLRCRLQDLHGNRQHQELLKTRRELPVFQFRQSVLDHVHKSNVVVVAGETGSGKSTQVHERSVQSDFLLTVVKGILGRRPDLKVILMSATLDSGKFSAYFSHCPVLNIPGRTFPVEVKHIEDLIEMTGYVADEDSPYTLKHSQLVEDVLKHLESAPPYCEIDGAVLIFLPGLADIQELFQIFALHSVLSSEDQGRVFAVPPAGIRKIVLATNIAETGITIPDVVFVIDSGKVKENRYNERSQMSSLIEVFISKANAKQRQGRAGRVRDGFCFRLYTAEKYHKMAEFTLPEILRVPLEELCLLIMPSSVQRAMSLLYEVGACFADTRELTPLGHHLASLPVNVRIGKMLIYAAILGCLEPVHKTSDMPLPDVLDISKVSSKTHDLDQQTVAMVKAVLCAGLYSQVAKAVAKTGVIFKELRTLFDKLLERKLAEPRLNLTVCVDQGGVVHTRVNYTITARLA
nr:hypothetical protein BaRGS_024879 [Batillaria attramentaria]